MEVYYYSASPPEQTARRAELERIANELGVGPGGATSSWMTHADAVEVVKGLIDLREKYQDVSSPQMNSAVDEFIDSLMRDLREGAKDSNNNDEFNDSAKGRLREAFDKLNNHIGDALGLDQLPVR